MKGVQCYELFGGIELKNHAFFILYENRNTLAGEKAHTNIITLNGVILNMRTPAFFVLPHLSAETYRIKMNTVP